MHLESPTVIHSSMRCHEAYQALLVQTERWPGAFFFFLSRQVAASETFCPGKLDAGPECLFLFLGASPDRPACEEEEHIAIALTY